MVTAKNLIDGESTNNKLWLVDLAGSERFVKINVQADRLKKFQNINRSLSALGDVILALANRSIHISCRQHAAISDCGESKTLMFVQINSSDKDLSETISSLNFATRVKGVELDLVGTYANAVHMMELDFLHKKRRALRLIFPSPCSSGGLLDLLFLIPVLQAASQTNFSFTLFFRQAPGLTFPSPCSSGGILDFVFLYPVLQEGSWTYYF
ncbi:Kinesin-like protein KIFC3 [Capsicum baccatum]|uniref:Kinesin-like protein KIFC3 n=1 Tax=Capsicum baccatum TaxID=33114 RepID=A0A2G2WCN6_CAPBA|nr:Kinesin-like protein KIFC3 [Capsicum baccatum]